MSKALVPSTKYQGSRVGEEKLRAIIGILYQLPQFLAACPQIYLHCLTFKVNISKVHEASHF